MKTGFLFFLIFLIAGCVRPVDPAQSPTPVPPIFPVPMAVDENAGLGETLCAGDEITYSGTGVYTGVDITLNFKGESNGMCAIEITSDEQGSLFYILIGKGVDETPAIPAMWCGIRKGIDGQPIDEAPVLNLMSQGKMMRSP